jgi:hypothetical protein
VDLWTTSKFHLKKNFSLPFKFFDGTSRSTLQKYVGRRMNILAVKKADAQKIIVLEPIPSENYIVLGSRIDRLILMSR